MFEPDIVVSAKEGADLFVVVEVKGTIAGMDAVEEALRRFMVQANCAVGLLVAPRRVRLFRNRFLTYTPDSVERVGDYPVQLFEEWANVLTNDRGAQMSRFESAVQDWLEHLTNAATRSTLPPALRRVLEDEVVPRIRDGEVRAAHHRYAS